MKKIVIYYMLLIVYIVLIAGCTMNDSKGTQENLDTFSEQAKRIVLEHYSDELIERNIELKQVISIFAEADIENEKLILGSLYSGMGQEHCDLFHVIEDKGQATIHGLAIGEEPISMGYSLNIVLLGDKTVIFGTLSDTNYDYENDVIKDVDYTEIEVIFSDGTVEKQNIENQDGYILVGATTSKIVKIILYEGDTVSDVLDELLKYDEIINSVDFSKVIDGE